MNTAIAIETKGKPNFVLNRLKPHTHTPTVFFSDINIQYHNLGTEATTKVGSIT